jgi:predicted  nucleic acid-binding Zn-ribbon protein
MNEVSKATKQLIDALKTERDDLKVQLHLISMEAKQQVQAEWDAVEHKWAQAKASSKQFNSKVGQASAELKDELEDVAENIGEMGEAMAKEIRASYTSIRDKLSSLSKGG